MNIYKIIFLCLVFSSCNSEKVESQWEKFKVIETFGLKDDFTTNSKEQLVCPPGFRYKVNTFLDDVKAGELFLFQCVNEQNENESISLTYKPSDSLNQVLYIRKTFDTGCPKDKDLWVKNHLDVIYKSEDGRKDDGDTYWGSWGSYKNFDSKVQCSGGLLMITLWKKKPK